MSDKPTPKLVSPRRPAPMLEAVRNAAGQFDATAWHVMDQRDNALIEQEILHGAGSNKFVYSFPISGQKEDVSGISVIGARHLASHYGGLKHRLVASIQKTGELFVFQSYPTEGTPMQVTCSILPELGDEPDFYGAVVEITDIKTGNSVQVERRENRFERRREGGEYERPHYATIAQSKGYRNGVLALIPQDVQIRWKQTQLSLGKNDTITDSVIDEKRAAVLRFAAAKAIPLDRRSVEALTLDQLSGLGDAAREGRVPAFVNSVRALGLDAGQEGDDSQQRQQVDDRQEQQQGTGADQLQQTGAGSGEQKGDPAGDKPKGEAASGGKGDQPTADPKPQAEQSGGKRPKLDAGEF